MKRLLYILLLFLPLGLSAQVIDSVADTGVGQWEEASPLSVPPKTDTVVLTQTDTVYILHTDTLTVVRVDTAYLLRIDTVTVRVADTAALKALQEKEVFYREILSANGVDKEKLEAERNYLNHMVDSLRAIVRIAEIEAVRKEEANKYLAERAKAAEEKVAVATNRKKKVRPIQGVAMRFYRTPAWEIRIDADGNRKPANRNGGNIEFDYVTGASVMLWDMTRYFNKSHEFKAGELPKFDQDFAYDLGLYVGFGGSNLFKNFYVGASFRFVDFFYLTAGFNVAEYQVLAEGRSSSDILVHGESIDDITVKAWLLKPFVSLSIDLDFLSYIKK
ncbi:MAG: hypothetical protein IJ524_02055 [Bacteroidales bacterium]|nr:hypothetical protein [Bacteroidales bacterium]